MRLRGASIDPLTLNDWASIYTATFNNVSGKTPVSSALVPGEKTGIFLVIGQSIPCNVTPTLYTATNARVHNWNLHDRSTYQAAGSLLGCTGTGGNLLTRLGDKLVNAGTFQRLILAPILVGGTYCRDWGPGGVFDHRIRVALMGIRATFGIQPTAILFDQGNEDATTSQADWQTAFGQVVATIRGMGCSSPIFVALESWDGTKRLPAIRAAQMASVNPSAGIHQGPDMDAAIPLVHRYDGEHPDDIGADLGASAYQTVLSAYF